MLLVTQKIPLDQIFINRTLEVQSLPLSLSACISGRAPAAAAASADREH